MIKKKGKNNMNNELNHFDSKGNAIMVDVTEKNVTQRQAIARGKIFVNKETYDRILQGNMAKGDVLAVARVAGIMATKKTSELIPMCHPLMLTKSQIDFEFNEEEKSITAISLVKLAGQTGVEMEALTGVNVALLTIYDMCKAIDKNMVISDIHLVEKTGGKSGKFTFEGVK
jgi:cyclic pyranopterin phosphate synthase